MFGKLLMTAFVFSQLTTVSYGTNLRILDQEAEKIANKVWTGQSMSCQYIQESLTFITKAKANELNELPSSLEDACNKATTQFQKMDSSKSKNFSIFAHQFRDLYTETKDEVTKFGLYKLFEGVTKKLLGEVQKANSRLKRENETNFVSTTTFCSDSDSQLLLKNFFDTVKSQ